MTAYPLMLFAAGLGTRMRPLTHDRPKPLIPVAGQPLIDHALALTDIPAVGRRVVNLHYRGDMLRAHLAGRDIAFSDESAALLDTGGGLRQALPLLRGDPVMTLNTDAVWQGPNPLDTLAAQFRPEMEALLLLVPPGRCHGHAGAGDFARAADGTLRRGRDFIYTGAQILRTERLAAMPDAAFSLNLLWNDMAARGGLYGAVYPGIWCDVGQPASIPLAESLLHGAMDV